MVDGGDKKEPILTRVQEELIRGKHPQTNRTVLNVIQVLIHDTIHPKKNRFSERRLPQGMIGY